MKRLLAIIASCLLCCAPANPYSECARQCSVRDGPIVRVCIDSAFTTTERTAVIEAARMWATVVCDRRFATQIVDGGDPPAECTYQVLRVDSSYPWVQARPEGAAAFSEPTRGIAWLVVDVIPAGLVRAAAAHELGHLLGASHSDGLMNAYLRDECIWQSSVDETRNP